MAECQPCLYNKKMSTYKDITKKEKLWQEKAAAMGRPVLLLMTWYSSLRTRFGRLRKNKSGDEAADAEMSERDVWIVWHFEFLRPYIYDVQKKALVSVSTTIYFTLFHFHV